MRVWSKHWKWIIGSIVVCELLALLFTSTVMPIYGSTATIELNKGSAGALDLGVDDVLSQQIGSGGDSLKTDLQTETAILESDSLALAVIQQLGLTSRPPFALAAGKEAAFNTERGLPLEEAPRTRTRLLEHFSRRAKSEAGPRNPPD